MARSRTAEFVALYRALETDERARTPLFRDPYARRFLSPALRVASRLARWSILRGAILRYADRRAPGARTSAVGRTRYIDDAVERARAAGFGQLVILGAGFDCRAHRLPLGDMRVFEVDRHDTQAYKRERLAREAPPPRAGVVYVAVDFTTDDLGRALVAAAWDRARPSLFVWEGVTGYLDAGSVGRVFDLVAGCAPGTELVFTYIHAGVLTDDGQFPEGKLMRRRVGALGEPWTYGIEPAELPALLASHGLLLDDDLGADDYRARFRMTGDALVGYRFYRIAIGKTPPLAPAA